MRRLLALLLLATLAPAASSARADEPTGTTVVVDWPGNGAAVTSPVTIVGWAASGEGGRGTGVDAVSVYLDGPADVGTALGRAAYGLLRPDVAVARGEGRYAPSGWTLRANVPTGARTLFVYAHLADRPNDEGWVGPWEVAVQIDGGAPVGGPTPREGPPTAISSGAAMPSARDGQPLGIAGGGSCLDREQGTGRCLTFGGSNYLACAVPDPDSGRCLVRPSTGSPGAGGPAGAAIRGSWSLYSVGSGPSNNNSTVDSSLSGATSQPGAQLSGPIGYGLGSLLGQTGPAGSGSPSGPPSAGTGPSALAGGGAASPSGGALSSTAPRSLLPRGGSSGGGGAGQGGATDSSPAANANSSANISAISLTSVQGGGQVQLNWNQIGSGGAVYEVRRCPTLTTPSIACTVIAIVQGSGSYLILQPEGVYLVRSVGPLGQVFGESNRLQLCCRG